MTACSGTPGRLTRALLAGLVTVAVAGCAETVAPDPIRLTIVSGDGQEAEVARALPGPLMVRVSGLDGLPRTGISVEWTVLEGDTLRARVWLFNRWPGTLRLKTMTGCFFQSGHPALLDAAGATVARAFFGCTQAVTTRRIAPADSLYAGWALDVRGVADGAYTLRFRFAVVEVNDVAAELPDVELPVNIRR
jgi:hypothetical protein